VSEEKLSCGIVLARTAGDRQLTLLLRAWHHWDFPKGIREPNEDPLQAAVRELLEETGIGSVEFPWGDRYFETGPYSHGKTARYYLGATVEDTVVIGPSPETGKPEHHEWRWVSFDEAYDLAAPRVRSVVHWARQIVGA
jgi:bis(5'-nucleosidyl)-tetraphosphatase